MIVDVEHYHTESLQCLGVLRGSIVTNGPFFQPFVVVGPRGTGYGLTRRSEKHCKGVKANITEHTRQCARVQWIALLSTLFLAGF